MSPPPVHFMYTCFYRFKLWQQMTHSTFKALGPHTSWEEYFTVELVSALWWTIYIKNPLFLTMTFLYLSLVSFAFVCVCVWHKVTECVSVLLCVNRLYNYIQSYFVFFFQAKWGHWSEYYETRPSSSDFLVVLKKREAPPAPLIQTASKLFQRLLWALWHDFSSSSTVTERPDSLARRAGRGLALRSGAL